MEQGQQQSFTASRKDLSSPAHDIKIHNNPSLVKVEMNYPKSFEGEKFFKDGDIAWVSRETADQFIEAGIATEVERTEDEQPEGAVKATDTTIATSGSDTNDVKLDAKKVTGTNAVHTDDSVAAAVASNAKPASKGK